MMFSTIQRWIMIGVFATALAGVIAFQYQVIKRKDAELITITQTVQIQQQTIEFQQAELGREQDRHEILKSENATDLTKQAERVDQSVTELLVDLVRSSQP